MLKHGRCILYLGEPTLASLNEILARFCASSGAILASSSVGVLRYAHQRIRDFPNAYERFENLDLELRSVSEVIGSLCAVAQVPSYRVANLEQRAAVAATVLSKIEAASPFYEVRNKPGFHLALVEALQEVERHRIPEEALVALGGKPEAAAVAGRQIKSAMEKLRLTTLSQKIESLIASRLEAPKGLKRIFWVGETDWPPIQVALAQWLQSCGIELHMSVLSHPTDPHFYPGAATLKERLREPEIVYLPKTSLPQAGVYGEGTAHTDQIEILEAANESLEVEMIARILRQKRLEGVSPERLCVFTKTPEFYGPLLTAAGERIGIRFDVEWREPVLKSPFAQVILDTLFSVAEPTPISLIPLVHSPYFRSADFSIDAAVRAIQEAIDTRSGWANLAVSETAPVAVRELAALRESVAIGDRKIGDWKPWLNELVAKMPFLTNSVDAGPAIAARDTSVVDAMIRSLELKRVATDPRQRIRLKEFALLAHDSWRDAEAAMRIKGDIRIVSEPSQIGDVSLVVVAGMVEGRFPKRRAEEPILLDRDRLRLKDGNPLWELPTSYDESRSQQREFHRLLCSCHSILFTWPSQINESDQVASGYLEDVRGYLTGLKESHLRVEDRFSHAHDALAPVEAIPAFRRLNLTIPKAFEELYNRIHDAVRQSDVDTFQEATVAEAMGRFPDPLSLSLFRSLKRCKFQYLCRAKFGLRPRRVKQFDDRVLEIIRQANLVTAESKSDILDALKASFDQYLDSMKREVGPDQVAVLKLTVPKRLKEFADREYEARQQWNLTLISQNSDLPEGYFRSKLQLSQGFVKLNERIDLFYTAGENEVPLPIRFAWASKNHDDDFMFESGLLAILAAPKPVHLAGIDSIQQALRKVVSLTTDPKSKPLSSTNQLLVKPAGSLVSAKSILANQIQSLDQKGRSREADATPGPHCARCGFASLCRRAQSARFQNAEVRS